MGRKSLRAVALLLVLFFSVTSAFAQPSPGRPGSLKDLIIQWAASQRLPPNGVSDQVNLTLVGGMLAVEELIGLGVSTAPVGSSTGAFTFTFNPQLQTWSRSTDTFGPVFTERSVTTGRGKVSVGLNFLHAGYDSLSGMSTSDGSFRGIINFQAPVGPPIASSRITFDASSDTAVAFAVFGVTDDFDVGVAVPWVRVSLGLDQSVYSASGVDLSPGNHDVLPRTSSAGLGDVMVFGKYRFWRQAGGGLAGEVAVQFPSGDADNLRSAGVTRTTLSAIWSRGGKISPHANVGYEFWSSKVDFALDGSVYAQNQVKYALGVDVEAAPRLTVGLDLVGRRLLNGGQLAYQTLPLQPGPTSPFPLGGTFQGLVAIPGGINDISLAPSLKWSPWGRGGVLSLALLGSLANEGLRANLTPFVGFEWDFGH